MNIKGYKLDYSRKIDDINSEGFVYTHEKTGAKAIVISNDDDNKVFCVGFRTPPKNSTGVAHILEHSVLCGSKKYPLKDPFVELVKGSLNTFLNAMTYPDKTIYPVASTNNKDFKNLMDVYLDAVFFPNIYDKKEIFLQEGWHYHLENPEDEIYYNGVVYNEMKGVYSTPENVLSEKSSEVMLPDTVYGVSSGGNPNHIPELSYEEFLGFHSQFYHPSNSYIYLYGDVDVAERLEYIADNYLNKFDKKVIDSTIKDQKPFDSTHYSSVNYSISKEDDREGKGYYTYSVVIGKNNDVKKYITAEIVAYELINSPASNIRKNLIASGFASDISANVVSELNQMVIEIMASNCKVDSLKEFEQLLNKLIMDEINAGFDKTSILGAINRKEFAYRESEFGATPKGLIYMLDMFKGILYNNDNAFIYLDKLHIFDELKELTKTSYFEDFVKEMIIDNSFKSLVEATPKHGYNDEVEEKIRQELKEYKESLSKEEIEELIEQNKSLLKFQIEPTRKEDLDKLPRLDREDLDKEAKKLKIDVKNNNGVECVYHDYQTNGISYMKLVFEINDDICPKKLAVLSRLLGKLETNNSDYKELKNKINLTTGKLQTYISQVITKEGKTRVFFNVFVNSISKNMKEAIDIVKEILFDTKFEDVQRFKEIMLNFKLDIENVIKESGHVATYIRAGASISPGLYVLDCIEGVSLYDEINEVLVNFDNIGRDYLNSLKNILDSILLKDNLTLDFTGSKEDNNEFINICSNIVGKLNTGINKSKNWTKVLDDKKTGIKIPSQIQFVTRVGNFKDKGLEYSGVLNVLRTILSYEYLWENVRVRGGAYGCMSNFTASGIGYLASYRDPNLTETNEVYEALPEWLKQFDVDEDRMLKYIIGSLNKFDTPVSSYLYGSMALNNYFAGVTHEDVQKERTELLECTSEDIKNCYRYIEAILESEALCVIGNETKIQENKEMFDKVRSL